MTNQAQTIQTTIRYLMPSLIGLLLAVAFQGNAQHLHNGYHRIRIHLDHHTLQAVATAGIDVTHGLIDPGKHFIADLSSDEVALLHNAGLSMDTLIADLSAYHRELSLQKAVISRSTTPCDAGSLTGTSPQGFTLGSMGGFFTYDELLSILDSMRSQYPDLISVRAPVDDTLLTHEGRPIYWVKISDQPDIDEDEPEVAYTALHHAREPGSLSQLIYLMWYLLERYDVDPRVKFLLDETELYFLPCLNPDGYLYNEAIAPGGGGMWRKNRRSDAIAPEGVDLNRNYGLAWGFDNFGSSPDPSDQDYRGPGPFSEPETQMVRNFCQNRELEYMLNYHSFGQLLIFPFSYNDQPAEPGFDVLAGVLSSENGYLAGTAIETVGYPVNGVSDDWMYGDTISKGQIVAVTPEISTFFWTAPSQIIPDCQSVLPLNLKLASLPHVYYEASAHPPTIVSSATGYLPFSLSRVGSQAGEAVISVHGNPDQFDSFGPGISYTLNQYELIKDSIAYSIAEGLPSGTELEFYLTTEDETGSRTDTCRTLLIVPGSRTLLFFEDGNTFDEWEVFNGNWDTTSAVALSPPVSIADSPEGQYLNNTDALLRSPVLQLPSEQIILQFWSRWDIEQGFDYVTLNAQPVGDSVLYPLCGLYTNPGSEYQVEGQPVYDGTQDDWVSEFVDLSDFGGQEIRLVFEFHSDPFVRGDGFFFDDLQVYSVNGLVTQTDPIGSPDTILFTVSPNPARSYVEMQLTQEAAAIVHFVELVDINGRVIQRMSTTGKDRILMSGLGNVPRGQYLLRMLGPNQENLGAEKLVLR